MLTIEDLEKILNLSAFVFTEKIYLPPICAKSRLAICSLIFHKLAHCFAKFERDPKLEFDLQKIVNDGKGYQVATLCKHLELLIALLRSRGIEGEEFKMVFAPDNNLTQEYVTLVDDVSRIVIDSDIELKSRISLQIEKPEMFRNTPDLLYALRMYLTGDSGANTITIMSVSDEI